MYRVDNKDQVSPLAGVPQSSAGAPIPFILSDRSTAVLAYYLECTQSDWDGSTLRIVSPITEGEPVAIVRFNSCLALVFGAPNDEAFESHPLASRGLEPYGTFEIQDSSWIRQLERMNSVHDCHDPKSFWSLRHLAFTFHDEIFECVCRDFEVVSVTTGSIASVVSLMTTQLRWSPH